MGIQETLSALSDKERRRILDILKKGKISSGDLAKEMNMTPQALSYHLKKMKNASINELSEVVGKDVGEKLYNYLQEM